MLSGEQAREGSHGVMLQKVLGATEFSACEPEKKSREVLHMHLFNLSLLFPRWGTAFGSWPWIHWARSFTRRCWLQAEGPNGSQTYRCWDVQGIALLSAYPAAAFALLQHWPLC